MNRNRYRLVFNETLGMMVPVSETARRAGKSGSGRAASGSALALAGVLLGTPAWAELPVASVNYAGPGTVANYHTNGAAQAYMNQVGNQAIVNFDRFNLSAGHDVQLRQVQALPAGFNDPAALVAGAQFTTLARIHDLNPSVIAGSISQAPGQKASLIMVNSNGIAFMGGSQVNLNSFTASSLNIADTFILDSFLQRKAQFEGTTGFVKVFEGAKITAGSQGRVMLIAPTVVNRGEVSAPDGQVMQIAGEKVFLAASTDPAMRGLLVEVTSRSDLDAFDTPNTDVKDGVLDGRTITLTNAADDKLGHATNAGTLSAARGNVTMMGYAVNQNGIARASTSVVSNGTVYLLATGKSGPSTARGGQVRFGAGSTTEVLPDVGDATAALDTQTKQGDDIIYNDGQALKSRVLALGETVGVAGGATIVVPSGVVDLVAMETPGDFNGTNDPVSTSAGTPSARARVHVAAGARISVAGLENVAVSAARNAMEVELRGDELKDTPVNQQGPLRGEKAYVDINRALARAQAGQSTLIAKDSLESYRARQARAVDERSTAGGQVNIRSQGEALLESGALIDLSGGSLRYTPAQVKTTLLSTGGKLVDLADAVAETRYDGIATRFVIDYGRWNKKEVIDLGQSFRFDPGYGEGKDAGTLNVTALGPSLIQSDIAGRTTVGELQREAGIQPRGAQLTVGAINPANIKLNQRVEIASTAATLPAGFGLNDPLPAGLASTLTLDPTKFGEGKVAHLTVYTQQAAEVREAIRTAGGGSVNIVALDGIRVRADMTTPGGAIVLQAGNEASASTPDIVVDDGVTLAARGTWVNDLPGQSLTATRPAIHGGTVTLSAKGDVTLGENSVLDVSAGARLDRNGKISDGNGGGITLDAGNRLTLGGQLKATASGKGGALTLKTGQRVQIGGPQDASALNLEADFFNRGGFARYSVTGVGLDIADGVELRPRLLSRELLAASQALPTGGDIDNVSRLTVREAHLRAPVDLTFTASGKGTPLGSLRLGDGARIVADDRARVSFNASERLTLLGSVEAHGGSISATLNRNEQDAAFDPASALWLGPQAVLDVSGRANTWVDTRGLTQGDVLTGGSVTLAAPKGHVVTAAGSRIDVSGAAPVRLDVPNESGGLGRLVASDAGSVSVAARESAILDGEIRAHAGSPAQRGGSFALNVSGAGEADRTTGLPTGEQQIRLAQGVPAQATGLMPGDAIPQGPAGVRASRVDTARLEAAGFDRLAFASEAIRLENDYTLGAGRALPLRDIALTGRVETDGSDARLAAHTVRFAPLSGAVTPLPAPVAGSGTLTVDAQAIDIGGLHLSGMAKTVFNGARGVWLSGQGAELKSAADLVFHGAVVAPATAARFTIDAPGRTVQFTRTTDTPLQPLSAQGQLTVKAGDIVQDGNLWAPLGQLDLQATNTLVFKNGSLTSVAATPGSVLPYGQVANGREWRYAGSVVTAPDGKSIRTTAAQLDMQPGAKLDLAGGGDLQAWEFTVGPGGSRDILAEKNTYAILPGYSGGYLPSDLQEAFDRPSGEAVYLSGVPGLAAGTYTLLPAHYALLPGAYAVKLDTGIKNVMPGQAYSRQDGVRIAAGYVTDSRANAPRDPNWQGVVVMTRDQVRARSEFTLSQASTFFDAGSRLPQDAGLLSVKTTGSGADALKLDAIYSLAPAAGGRGAEVDISAVKLAITSGTPTGLDPDAVRLDVARLDALGADSLLLGGTRSRSGGLTTLAVDADSVTLANDAANPLRGAEIMLAAKDRLTLRSGSLIDAQGPAGDAGDYVTPGNGAFVRAAATSARFTRSGAPDGSQGTLDGMAGSVVRAADSIVLDATQDNAFKGETRFSRNGAAVAGNLATGATRINFGAAPASAGGITYSQADLDALGGLASLTLTSYSTFDLYGAVNVGGVDGNGKPTLQNLTLNGAGLAGVDNAGATATLRARNLTLANPADVAFAPGGAPGSGSLAITADTLTLGAGAKQIAGFGVVNATANELVGSGKGSLTTTAPLTLNVARIRGERGANQSVDSAGAMILAQHTADRALAPVTAMGAQWAFRGTSVDFDTLAALPSGGFKLAASTGDVNLGANARVDVAGRSVRFFDVTRPSWGGTVELTSQTGNVGIAAGAQVDVSGAPGADAGTLIVRAANGSFNVVPGTLRGEAAPGANGQRGEGARADIDVGSLGSYTALNDALNSGGFDGERSLRVRTGNVTVAAGDTTRARIQRIAADAGGIDVAGELDASGADAGRIELFAKNDVNLLATARLKAVSSDAREDGGEIEIGTRDGVLNLLAGSAIDVTGGAQARGGSVLLRAPRTGSDVAVGALASTVTGARSLAIEAVRGYDNIDTLTATGASSGSTLSLATISADNTAFAGGHAAIKARLGRPDVRILSGVEVRSNGNLTLGTGTATTDWNLSGARAGGEAGVLTLRAAGNLAINSNLSDGFSHATALASGTTPATLLTDDSWSYRLVAGADRAAANPLAVTAGAGDFTLAGSKLVRTGTGDIRIAAGRDIRLANAASAIYTAGKQAAALPGFTVPVNGTNFAQFSEQGGNLSMMAQGDILGTASTQLYSQWLFRQGRTNATADAYLTQPAWWVRFDQFQQGVGALGGGDVRVVAAGKVQNLSASAPTQGRMASTTVDPAALHVSGGGDVRIEAGQDVLGGQYYAGRGRVDVRAGGAVSRVADNTPYTLLALGDAEARVQAQGDASLQAVINPHLIRQNAGATPLFNVTTGTDAKWTLFSTYGEDSGVSAQSLMGTTRLANGGATSNFGVTTAVSNANYDANIFQRLLPSNLLLTALQGDVEVGGQAATLNAAPRSAFEILAAGSVWMPVQMRMSDAEANFYPDPARPTQLLNRLADGTPKPGLNSLFDVTLRARNAPTPTHLGDPDPVRIYAAGGDIVGTLGRINLTSPKAVRVEAARDIRNFGIQAQHVGTDDVSRIAAGRDIAFDATDRRETGSRQWFGGSGRLEVEAGRDIDLGTTDGIVARGDLDNPVLTARGMDIQLLAGAGAGGLDVAGTLARLIAKLDAGATDTDTLWQARWLTGDKQLTPAAAPAAVHAVAALPADEQRERVRALLFTALRETGRDANLADSGFAGDFARGYAALELAFPGIGQRNPDGSFSRYQGNVNLFASRVKTERGGNIEFMIPGGELVVGLPNTPAVLVNVGNDVLGMVAAAEGDILGFARGDMRVNQSRILTVGGGDVLLWSSEGDIDAGKGKKTATAVPPPIIKVDAQGNVTQELQGAVTGSGIGALTTAGGTAGDVDLIAPKGTVNAGDAGIRAGNLNIAAQVVLGADNISVSGTSTGTPVADTSAVTAASSGASNAGNDVSSTTAALASNLAEAARAAEELKKAFKPTFISAEVIGYGD